MDEKSIYVKMPCPLLHSEQLAFFTLVDVDGEPRIYKENFAGCNNGYHDCPECGECKEKAYQVLLSAQR